MDFPAYPKTQRLEKIGFTITEKIDGTNGIVKIVDRAKEFKTIEDTTDALCHVLDLSNNSVWENTDYTVLAGSRTRWLYPGKTTDNFGFAAWVQANAEELIKWLGEGTHYGEWWGAGIQRTYGLTKKNFSLFNPHRYAHLPVAFGHSDYTLSRVPSIMSGNILELGSTVEHAKEFLLMNGSLAAPGYMNTEGLIVRLSTGEVYKEVWSK